MTIEITSQIAKELALNFQNVSAVLKLFSEGNTIPFIARYRKEQTGNLDEVAIRSIQERAEYLHEFYARRQSIIESIQSQGKLTDELNKQLLACMTKQELEDLYMPYKPKRRTRAAIAKEKGLEPLAQLLLEQHSIGDLETAAQPFINPEKGVQDSKEAWAGARDIVAEIVAEQAALRGYLRTVFFEKGILYSKVIFGKEQEGEKFRQYFDFHEPLSQIASHRYLAMRRGEAEEVLLLEIALPDDELISYLKHEMRHRSASPFGEQLEIALRDSFRRLLRPSIETEVRLEVKAKADGAAVKIFSDNLHQLLMASPLGSRAVIGIDPGFRSGCKCAAVDATGKFLETVTFYLHHDSQESETLLKRFFLKHNPYAIALGNGTASREAEALVRKVVQQAGIDAIFAVVSEAGASVYSASDIAREEFPNLDVTIRGAISIARRLQDPLAELVKVDPKSIGVGQYQHDVYQPLLQQKLSDVVETCVNSVGVELNTASASLLSYVAGIGNSLAEKIVRHREAQGLFRSREDLFHVAGFGPRTFQQAAGFLRLRDAKNPLDTSAVHPERYPLVEKMAKDLGVGICQLIGNTALVSKIDIRRYVDGEVGEPTLRDIVSELQKPGRDPRAVFEAAKFKQDVCSVEDVRPGMVLEGIVTNITAFGAFVDVGVHQDGLLHISAMADHFVKDPFQELSVGQKVTVRVAEVDAKRKRISLTRKSGSAAPAKQPAKATHNPFAGL